MSDDSKVKTISESLIEIRKTINFVKENYEVSLTVRGERLVKLDKILKLLNNIECRICDDCMFEEDE